MAPSTFPTSPPDGLAAGDDAITIASAPAGHPYVAAISAAPAVVVLPDPPVPGAPAGLWWPPAVLEPEWIEKNKAAARLLHIHFGTESFSPGQLTAAIRTAHSVGWPVVFTAHDLEHPQLEDQQLYAAQLDVLIRESDAVTTLTPGAASVIAERWGRRALVIAHPSVLAPEAVPPRVRASENVLIGVHLKDLRPNVDGPVAVRTLLESTARLRADGVPAVAEVRLHHRVRDEDARDQVRRLCAQDEHATLVEHERLSDAELAVALSRLDACVLPYRHGTHSGWLELCWDLGVPVAAPALGFYAQQHLDGSVETHSRGEVAQLTGALTALLASEAATRAGTQDRLDLCAIRRDRRRHTDAEASRAHARLYRRLLDGRTP